VRSRHDTTFDVKSISLDLFLFIYKNCGTRYTVRFHCADFYLLYIAFANTDIQSLFIILYSFQNTILDYGSLPQSQSQLGARFYKITYRFCFTTTQSRKTLIFSCAKQNYLISPPWARVFARVSS